MPLILTILTTAPTDMIIGIKEQIAGILEPYGDCRVLSVESEERQQELESFRAVGK